MNELKENFDKCRLRGCETLNLLKNPVTNYLEVAGYL